MSADSDFGKNNTLHGALIDELFDQGTPELRLFSGIKALLDDLVDSFKVSHDVDALLATSEPVRDAAKEMLDSWVFSRLYADAASTAFARVDWPAAFLTGTRDLKMADTKNASAYRIGDGVWLSVETTWQGNYEAYAERLAQADL